jgi:hypothetical protein
VRATRRERTSVSTSRASAKSIHADGRRRDGDRFGESGEIPADRALARRVVMVGEQVGDEQIPVAGGSAAVQR